MDDARRGDGDSSTDARGGETPPSREDEREQMLATLSHDLKNPLSAVLVGAQNLTRLAVPDDVAPRLRRYAEAIQRAGHRMNDLLRDLLELTRLERESPALDLGRRPAEEIVALALKPLADGAAARAIALRIQVTPADLTVHCDGRRASQALGNIVGNAVKHSKDGASIDIEVTLRDGAAQFTVRDTGSGIGPAELPKVLGPYWHSSDSPRSGMGIGLPLAKAIVDAHGGRIWADSVEGQGSTFSFTLPAG